MSRLREDGIPVDAVLALHAQVASGDRVVLWQRVGTLQTTERGLVVEWDEETRYLASLWRPGARVSGARGASGRTVRFGVFVGRRSVVVGESWVSAEELWRLRQQMRGAADRAPRGSWGGPRAPRSGWPRT